MLQNHGFAPSWHYLLTYITDFLRNKNLPYSLVTSKSIQYYQVLTYHAAITLFDFIHSSLCSLVIWNFVLLSKKTPEGESTKSSQIWGHIS